MHLNENICMYLQQKKDEKNIAQINIIIYNESSYSLKKNFNLYGGKVWISIFATHVVTLMTLQ